MTEFQFFKELTDLDDVLVLQADTEARPRRTARLISRLPLAAALTLLLAATVCAVSLTLSVRYVDRAIQYDGFSLTCTAGYGVAAEEGHYAAEIEYHLEPVALRDAAPLCDALTVAWEQWSAGYEHFTGAWLLDESGARRRFDGLAEVEEALGLPLTRSAALDREDGPCFMQLLIADPAEAALEYANTGRISPAALILTDALALDGSESGLTVFVALQDRLPAAFQRQEVQFLQQEGAPVEQRFQTHGGAELILLQTGVEGEEYNTCVVVWCEGGIGYLAELRGRWDGAPAQDLLTPLLTELETRKGDKK